MTAVHSQRDGFGGIQPICHELTLVRPTPLTASRADSGAILIRRSGLRCGGSHPEPRSNGSQVRMPANSPMPIWVLR